MRSFSCLVIGDAAITVRCAEAIVSAGHELLGVVTADERCAAWAAASSIPIHFSTARVPLGRDAIEALACGRPCDYLFSIHNVRILSPEVIGFAGRMAINYHDALLPRYAGLHAGSWAIAGGERVHGVTWHRVTETIDDGDILVQRSFALRGDETAWTLGGLCTEAAIESFAELLPRLASGRLEGTRQQLDARSYFYGWMKPSPGCVLPLDGSAETIEAMVRALDFGAADNPIGIAKVLSAGEAYFVSKATILDSASQAAPGTVLSAAGGSIDVSTRSRDVRLWVKPAGVVDSTTLARLNGALLDGVALNAEWLTGQERKFRRAEAFWASRYLRLAPLVPPELSGEPGATLASEAEVDLRDFALAGAAGVDRAHHALAAVLGWLRGEIGQPFDVGLGEPDTMREIAARRLDTLLVARPPLRVDFARDETLARYTARLREERTERHDAGTCSIDLPHRLRRLRSAPRLAPAVVVDVLDAGEPAGCPQIDLRAINLAIEIDADGTRLSMRSGNADRDVLLRLAQRFRVWLAECEARPDRAMRATGLADLRPADERVAPDISTMFRNEVARNPDSIAIESDAGAWSYAALAARVDRLASSLQRRGVAAESLVAIRAARLADLVTAMLGVLAAGGAFVVIDPREPGERAKRILGDAFPDLALGDAALHPLCPEVPFLPIGIADALELPPVGAITVSESDLAYVAFTSGSTGARKGVAIERGSLSRYIESAGEFLGLTAGDRVLQLGSPAFDLAYEQIFGALCHGATLVASDGHDYAGTADLLARCASRRITVLDPPTNLWSQAARDVSRLELEIPESIRIVVIGGDEALAPDVRAWVSATRGRSRLVNGYGPTEATIVATWWEAPADLEVVPDRIPIGQPMNGVEARVLDTDGAAVPDGEEGELWLGGFGLARGYHRRPDLTATSFQRSSGVRLYRTGDLVRRRGDGLLEFLGRIDRQLKIGGRRVEPGEVESVMLACPGVVEAAVSPVTTSDGRKSLAAWVVLRPGADGDDAADLALRAFVVERLPSFLRPSRIERVASIPRLTGGKVDFEALKAASGDASASRPELSDPVERTLASIFQRLLGSGPVSRGDDFFELGGDSLSAVHLLAEIETAFGARLPIARLLGNATLVALARDIREGGIELPGCVIPLQPNGDAPPLFCVHGLGGHLLRLSTLARELSPDQPFFGLQSPGLDDDQPVPETVAELARLFLREVTARVGDGTVHLTGMSFGGIVALEMARQAVAQGRRVGLVAMFDTYLTEVLTPPAPLRGAALLRHRLRRAIGDRLGRSRRRLRRTVMGADRIEKANEYRNFTRVLELNDEAMRRHELGAYGGTVTFFAASQRDPNLFDQFERRVGCTIEVVPVPGDHMTMYDPPHVAVLAAEIRRVMRRQVL